MCADDFFDAGFGEAVSFNWVNDTSVTLLLVKARLLRLFLSIICCVGLGPRFKSLVSSLLRTWVCTDIFFLGLGLSSDVKTVVSPFLSDIAAALDACLRRTSGARDRRVDFKDRGDWLERLTLGDAPLTLALLVGWFSGVLWTELSVSNGLFLFGEVSGSCSKCPQACNIRKCANLLSISTVKPVPSGDTYPISSSMLVTLLPVLQIENEKSMYIY